jgi:outer membrane protein, multidrug efflux system
MRKSNPQSTATSTARLLLTLAITATLSACAVGPDYHQPKVWVADQFAEASNANFNADDVATHFWTQFNDPTLTSLVNDALLANHDLRIALANFNASRAIHRETRFDLAPTVTAGAGYTEQLYAKGLNTARDVSYYDGSIDAVWELDVFGRARRNVERSRAEVQAAEANLHDAQVMVTAEVTRTYFELRGQQEQLRVAQRNVQNQRETQQLTEARLEAGSAAELDVVRAQALLSNSSATIAPLQAAVVRSIHRLGVLTGREPDALQAELSAPAALPDVPTMTAVGDPATLLRRRPDIRRVERQLAASTANIGIAVADLFPHVTFTGSVGVAAVDASGLGDAGSGTRLVAPGISWAAFDLGRVRARIAAARALNDGELARYQQTVLNALEETENALVNHARARERLAQLTEAATASGRAAELARIRYQNGATDFLEVLDSERSLLQAEDQLAQSRTETATTLVAVYKALGGGWSNAPLPHQVVANR